MKIAVAIDGSDNALRAAEHAIMLTTYLPKAELEVIYVADYKKAVDDRLLSQNPEGLALKREQIVHPVLERTEARPSGFRSEEHTSELQSRFDLVCRLLLEKKNI